MAHSMALLACVLVLLASIASAAVVEHTLNIGDRTLRRVCGEQVKTVANGSLPGPVIRVREGDTLIVHVLNNSPHNMTIHWHGVFQLFSAWADGPAYITQCPIVPKTSYTYKFNVTGQEGTLWWHCHISMLRETVYGALIVRPRKGRSYPFPKPFMEVPILLGEWWNANVLDVEHQFIVNGGSPSLSDAFTINGQPGDLYKCSTERTFKLKVVQGKTYLLRMINAVLHDHMFFKIANHTFTVVAVDADYVEPYNTDVIVLASGHTADVLFTANQPPNDYYMASHAYSPALPVAFTNTTTTAIIHYKGSTSSSAPLMPDLPDFRDTATAHKFFSNLTSLTNIKKNPFWLPVPEKVDEKMFITIGLALQTCGTNLTCATPPYASAYRFSSTMNNVSFQRPSKTSILEAYHHGVKGIYTDDFPDYPPVEFDYTNLNFSFRSQLTYSLPLIVVNKKETRVKRLKYNSVVEIVLQSTAFVGPENHPIHFHGVSFYVLAQGFGNYNENSDRKKFNLLNPQKRSTIAVPFNGWAVIRFVANNPGVWFVHCHRETHIPWGLTMAFIVENGPTISTSLPPPPPDLPYC